MRKRKWVLLILVILLFVGYIKLFYKTWSEKTVPASADCVVALDVKRITNTLLWNLVTTPSQWKTGKLFSKKSRDTSWRDMFSIPDYILAFHSKNQPANNWYVSLSRKSKEGFEAGLKKFDFEKINGHEFVSRPAGLYLFVQDENILAAKASIEDSNWVRQVARELFTDKKFIARTELEKAVDAKSHLAVYLPANTFLKEAAVVSANFDKEKIRISGTILPASQYVFREENFLYASGSLSSLGFTQPPPALYNLLDQAAKEKISTAINLHMDSVFAQNNTSYSLNLQGIKERTDSAITYSYDDEFNKVENLVVNTIQEPSFIFFINGNGISSVHHYLQQNSKLERTPAGEVFLPMPLVRSYCRKRTDSTLSITAFNYDDPKVDTSIRAVLFFHLAFTKIPKNLLRYLPGALSGNVENLDEFNFAVTRKNEQLHITGMLTKRKNSLSLFKF